jgi:uncharacterized protein with PIN domain
MKFIVDANLGKLAKELRVLGYDTLYYAGKDFHELIQLARLQERVILTRNARLTAKGVDCDIILITEDSPPLQLKELLWKGIVSLNEKNLFSRCLLCNSVVDRIGRQAVEGKVPDFIFHLHQEFYRCLRCRQIYWPGSHLEKMKMRLNDLFRIQGVKDSSNQAK